MISFELYFDSDMDGDDITTEDDLSVVRVERRKIRDSSNPLDLPSYTYVFAFQ